jgi:transposase
METHQPVFRWVLELVAERGLGRGKTVGIDATTLEANATMRSIVRRDRGEGYEEFLRRLAEESGIVTPTREQLANVERERSRGYLQQSRFLG